jgi:hypothetical protein
MSLPPEARLQRVLDRVMHVWSLIKMVPERRLLAERSLVAARLYDNTHMTDDELVVAGLKHLYRLDAPANIPRIEIERKDNQLSSGALSDKEFLARFASLFPTRGGGK